MSLRFSYRAFQLSRIVVRLLRGQHLELWIGDSHSAYLNGHPDRHTLMHNGANSFTWWLGPRLMWSLAHNDFPLRVRRAAKIVGTLRVGRHVTAMFVSGEIDVRCHLAAPGNNGDLTFVGIYLEHIRRLCRSAGVVRCFAIVPVPPMGDPPLHPAFPVRGSIQARVARFEQLRSELHETTVGGGYPEIVDATAALSGKDGTMRREFSDDNCHTNARGVRQFRAATAVKLARADQ